VDVESCNVIWYPIIWVLWMERNKCVFNEEQFNVSNILESVQVLGWKWLRYPKASLVYSLSSCIFNPLQSIDHARRL